MRTFLIIFWGVDAAGALVRVEYFDSAQPQNAWVKVFTHAQVFAKIPVNGFTENMASKVASKAASKKGFDRLVPSWVQKPAEKTASFINARKDGIVQAIEDKKLGWKWLENTVGKYAPDIVGESLSAGVGDVWDYTRKAENFKAEDAAASFLSGTATGFYKSLITAPVKAKYSAKDTKNTSVYNFAKRTVANDMASRAANASVDWIDKGVQRRLLIDSARNPKPVSERQAERLLAKDFQDAVMGNSKSNFKSAASGFKGAWDDAKDQAKMGAKSMSSAQPS